jgi:hypothetical protein
MKLAPLNDAQQIMDAAEEVRVELSRLGENTAVDELSETLKCFYTTASESIGEVRRALIQTRDIWETVLQPDFRALAVHIIQEAERLLGIHQ